MCKIREKFPLALCHQWVATEKLDSQVPFLGDFSCFLLVDGKQLRRLIVVFPVVLDEEQLLHVGIIMKLPISTKA